LMILLCSHRSQHFRQTFKVVASGGQARWQL
jgi:hypothetical protein